MNKIGIICDKKEYVQKIKNSILNKLESSQVDIRQVTRLTDEYFHMYLVYVSCAEDFQIVNQIQNQFPYVMIALFSDHDELVYQAWEYPVLFFMRINKLEEDLKRFLKKVVIGEKNTRYMYHHKKKWLSIRYDNILYFSEYQNTLIIHLVNSTFIEERKTLKNLMQEISPFAFIRISKSYVINKAKIKMVDKDDVILVDGTVLRVSKIYRNNLNCE